MIVFFLGPNTFFGRLKMALVLKENCHTPQPLYNTIVGGPQHKLTVLYPNKNV